ncbi:hypothetical protein QE152_g12762 [Popillia japonica]|uniref:Uncharacterized protein n=1 Tax=Popillia japonica TaxID=7064 RepID=A0AAW1LQT7_POPJA
MEYRRELHLCVFVHKAIAEGSPRYINSLLGTRRMVHDRDLRHPHLFDRIGWLKMEYRRELHLCVFVHKAIAEGSARYINSLLGTRRMVHDRDLRHLDQLAVQRHRYVLFNRSFSYSAAKYYNALPHDFKTDSVSVFRRKVISLLREKQRSH